MVQLIDAFEKLGFSLQDDGTYTGYSKDNETIIFEFKNHYLNCNKGNSLLFSILFAELKLQTLLILLTEFGIIDETLKK